MKRDNTSRRLHYMMASGLTPNDPRFEKFKEYYENKLKNDALD